MPQTITLEPGGTERVVVLDRSRASSGGSASVHSHPSSGGSRSYSGSAGSDGWTELEAPGYDDEDDGIEPSDSASRSRPPSSRRHTTEARPAPTRRHSSRRIIREDPEPEEEEPAPRRHHSSRSRRHHSSRRRRVDSVRVPSDESSSTVASADDYPYGHHGAQYPPRAAYPPPSGFRHMPAPGHGGYPPSVMTSGPGFTDPYAAQALVHMPQQDAFGYPSSNPFSPQGPQQNPFSPMSTASGTSYFQMEPHAPPMHHHQRPAPQPRPQSYAAPSSHYGSEISSPYQHPGMPPYPGYMMPGMAGMPGYPPMPGWYPPPSNISHSSSPAPPAEKSEKSEKSDDGLARLEALMVKQEEARVAREKEIFAKAEADAAAAASKIAKEEEEKKKKEEIAEASKKAKEEAEKKAAEAAKKAKEEHEKKLKDAQNAKEEAEKEHEKKLKDAQNAKEEAEKKQKELEEEKKKLTPAPDTTKAPIKFKDAVGRKFSFPYHLCKTWKGMEGLIKQAFLHVDVIGEHVHQGHYDLTGPDGEIILPQVWDTMLQPDWEVSMHMWPMPEEEEDKKQKKKKDKLSEDAAALQDPFASLSLGSLSGLGGLGDLGIVDPGKKKSKKDGSKKKKNADLGIIDVPPPPGIPPPPNFPPGMLPDPLGMAGLFPGITPVEQKKDKTKQKPKAKSPGFASWFAGGSAPRPSKKDDEKLDLVRRKSGHSGHSQSDQAACVVM